MKVLVGSSAVFNPMMLALSLPEFIHTWILPLALSSGLMLCSAVLVAAEVSLLKHCCDVLEPPSSKAGQFLLRHAAKMAPVLRFGMVVLGVAWGFWWIQFSFVASTLNAYLLLAVFVLQASLWVLFGLYLPREWALRCPKTALRLSSAPAILCAVLLWPWFKLLQLLLDLFRQGSSKLSGKDGAGVASMGMRLQALLGAERLPASPYLRNLMDKALHLNQLRVTDVLLPRDQVQYFSLGDGFEENLDLARRTGHTRFPLCKEGLDDCVGIVHIKDVFHRREGEAVDLQKLCRTALRFAADMPLEVALRRLLAARLHMAVVQDEFGGVLGLVTLEDILEELVGDIDDEFDTPSRELVVELSQGVFQVDGLAGLRELGEALGCEFSMQDASTFGGFLIAALGRIPRTGERLELKEPKLEVLVRSASLKRVLLAQVARLEQSSDEAA